MTKVYISSTFRDLVKFREASAKTLRQMNKVVIAMEDYTASDERPLERCLADVEACDLYIGIFAWRYGYVPTDHNPDGKSITQLEYERARDLKKPRLMFLVDDSAPWLPADHDKITGEGESGRKILALREQLKAESLCNFFKGPEDLAISVSTSVSNWQEKLHGAPSKLEVSLGPLPRDITDDIYLIYSDIDSDYAAELAGYLKSQGLRVVLDPRAIFADAPEDFRRLERTIRRCHGAILLISDRSAGQMEEQRRISTVFEMGAARTGPILTLCRLDPASLRLADWQSNTVVDIREWRPRESSPPTAVRDALAKLIPTLRSGARWVGLPVIIAAMTSEEAEQLDLDPEPLEEKLSKIALQQLKALKAAVPPAGMLARRYGSRRDQWRPFNGEQADVRGLLNAAVDRLNAEAMSHPRFRMIKPQYYGLDELMRHKMELRPIFNEMASNGCILILDEYSLFHPDIHSALASSKLLSSDLVSLVSIAPSNPYSVSPFDLIEHELSERLTTAFERFALAYDPQCELSVGDDRRLGRWLNISLPQAVETLQEPGPNRQLISKFASEQDRDPAPRMGSLLYSIGGTL